MAMSPAIFRALFSAAVIFEWFPFALVLIFGWAGALRPAEMVGLRWGDLLYDAEEESAYILIANPKTRKRSAKKQYVRVDAEEACEAARLVHRIGSSVGSGSELRSQRLCSLSLDTFRKRFRFLVERLELPSAQFTGIRRRAFEQGGRPPCFPCWIRSRGERRWKGCGASSVTQSRRPRSATCRRPRRRRSWSTCPRPVGPKSTTSRLQLQPPPSACCCGWSCKGGCGHRLETAGGGSRELGQGP